MDLRSQYAQTKRWVGREKKWLGPSCFGNKVRDLEGFSKRVVAEHPGINKKIFVPQVGWLSGRSTELSLRRLVVSSPVIFSCKQENTHLSPISGLLQVAAITEGFK